MTKFDDLLTANARIADEYYTAASLADDPEVAKALQFFSRLDALANKYQFSSRDIILLLDPRYGLKGCYGMEEESNTNSSTNSNGNSPIAPAPKKRRKPRPLKSYRNPHTGEVVQTKGANHTVLKQWKQKYGADTVQGWASQ